MQNILAKYIPERAVERSFELIKKHKVHLKIVNQRITRHGDYKKANNGQHIITVNASGNPYQFLITLIHEIAHLVAFEHFGRQIKPHGIEWKNTFTRLMLPFINPQVFPVNLLPLLAQHFKNPKASSSTDSALAIALKKYDKHPNSHNSFIYELPLGSTFSIYNGKVFKKGPKRVKRYECVELKTGKLYLFQPNAEVVLITTS